MEEVPPVPPLPTETKDDATKDETTIETPKELPAAEDQAPMADATPETKPDVPVETKPEPVQPVEHITALPPAPTKALPAVPTPQKKSSRHSRHDSAMQAPAPPKRSSSFRSVLNTYYKIFGGSPKKTPKHEKLPEEAERLRKLVKKYEAQLEEASEILLLQDKVIARWEKDATDKGLPVAEVCSWERCQTSHPNLCQVSSNGVTAVVPAEASAERGIDTEPAVSQNGESSENTRSLGLIRESSKEMLSEVAAQEANDSATNGESKPTVRLVEDAAAQAEELESTRRNLAAAQAAADGYAKRYHELEKTAEESANALAEANATKEKLEKDLDTFKAKIETTKRAHEEVLNSRSADPAPVDISVFDNERSALQSRIDELEKDLAASRAAIDEQSQGHEEHKAALSKELEDAHAAKLASAGEVEKLTAAVEEAQQNHKAALADHEATKTSLAEHVTVVASHKDLLAKKNEEHEYAIQHHERTVAEHSNELEAAASKLQKITLEHEALNAKHSETVAALAAAEAKASAATESQSDEHKAALDALSEEVKVARAELEESNALVESMKKEHGDASSAMTAELEQHRASLEKLDAESKAHQDRALALDEDLNSAKTAHKSAEDAHAATKAELESLGSEKTDLLAKLAILTTASAGHDTQVAELEKVNEELAELRQELEGHATTKSDLEAKIATLEAAADEHTTTKTDLETSRALVADLEGKAEGHASARADLEAKIAALEDAIDQHAATQKDLESSRALVADLESKAEGHATAQADLESKIAALEADAAAHGTSQTELHAKIADLESAADGHAAVKSDLESRIADLQAGSEKHSGVMADLEVSRARVAELEEHVKQHAATRSELDSAQTQIGELKAIAVAHESQKTEFADAKTQINSLTEEIEAHRAVKDDLTNAQAQIAELEKSVETGKADQGLVTEKLASIEASLAAATTEQERLTASLSEKETALQKALEIVAEHETHLAEKLAALSAAQEALEKAKAEAVHAEVLSKNLKSADEKVASLETELASSNEKHEAEKASLSSKVKDIWKLREQNDLLQQQLDAAHENERITKASVAKLETDLRSAQESKPTTLSKDKSEDYDSSGFGKAALAAGALGAVGAGAFGVSKLMDDDEGEASEEEVGNDKIGEDMAKSENRPTQEDGIDAQSPASRDPVGEVSFEHKATEEPTTSQDVSSPSDDKVQVEDEKLQPISDALPEVLQAVEETPPTDATPDKEADVDAARAHIDEKPEIVKAVEDPIEDTEKLTLDTEQASKDVAPLEVAKAVGTPQTAPPVEITPIEPYPDEVESASIEKMPVLSEEDTDEAPAVHSTAYDVEPATPQTAPPVEMTPVEPYPDELKSAQVEKMPEVAEEDGAVSPVVELPNDVSGSTSSAETTSTSNATMTTEAPKIKCLTCGDDMEMEKLADHFCTPAISPDSEHAPVDSEDADEVTEAAAIASNSDDQDDVSSPGVSEAVPKQKIIDDEPTSSSGSESATISDVEKVEVSTESPATLLVEAADDRVSETPLSKASEADTKLVPVEAISTDDVSAIDNKKGEEVSLASSNEPIGDLTDADGRSEQAIEEEQAASSRGNAAVESIPSPSDDPHAKITESMASPTLVDEDKAESVPADASSDIASSPSSPQTPSKKKSVRWEDIESSKQSTPVDELERQLEQPVVNGNHVEATADKHSIGPGSPVVEIHGLAIADVPFSEEPEKTDLHAVSTAEPTGTPAEEAHDVADGSGVSSPVLNAAESVENADARTDSATESASPHIVTSDPQQDGDAEDNEPAATSEPEDSTPIMPNQDDSAGKSFHVKSDPAPSQINDESAQDTKTPIAIDDDLGSGSEEVAEKTKENKMPAVDSSADMQEEQGKDTKDELACDGSENTEHRFVNVSKAPKDEVVGEEDDTVEPDTNMPSKKTVASKEDDMPKEENLPTPLPAIDDGPEDKISAKSEAQESEAEKQTSKDDEEKLAHTGEGDASSVVKGAEKEDKKDVGDAVEKIDDLDADKSAPSLGQKLVEKTSDLVSSVKDKLVVGKDDDEVAK